ncbi:c-type cytochrome biogenesis protein CcsB [Alkalilimnicola ehrlichii]|uniref:C-type cytochrome biogenesis protein CcsB n=1 Tax=Alkalilimnicola ehrlichii TaxID=351052 RepID=A0A3E0WYP0_9GAMM|nr:c-type cytochrome biogenesis protein CcsB [Alkalilimnicola ehrlichii]RFA30160.1 c-type cytochrome biogenesis protein CcsB [Alkalilimnicola ehrlichii]RFA37509.1 c-type cytochrome biogenesis protein CcsB [Alkalilimnicola ehrlichii]
MATPNDVLNADYERQGFLSSLKPFDWVWMVACVVGYLGVLSVYGPAMDRYEHAILVGTVISLMWLGWYWKPIRVYGLAVAASTTLALFIYPDMAAGEERFLLKYLLSSQSATMWMCALFIGATVAYFAALLSRSAFVGKTAAGMTWCAAAFGLIGLLVRWHESYLLWPGHGYIPVANLYEVFIQFAVVTALLYLYYEERYRTRALGGFVMLVISSAVIFLLWYHFDRQAHEIEPLIPALQSWWMKLHVPTNFVAYGAFAVAAMVAVAYLFKLNNPEGNILGRLPSFEQMDDVMYKTIALGFAFFTLATILGALWAAEAWGGYWSWDPKETWALIVWLNYAAWLHLRFTKGWRGAPMAWWAIIGLFVTLFAFLGVNLFLSGLHSYGAL